MTRFSLNAKVLGLVLLILLVMVFAFIDIGISSSESAANSNVGSYSSGKATDRLPEPIYVYVEKEGVQDETLTMNIKEALEKRGFDVNMATELQDEYPSQALFVSVNSEDGFYTPVYTDSEIDVEFVYSSSGSSEYFEKFRSSEDTVAVRFTSNDTTDSYQLLMQGSIEILDTSRGLFSIRYHERHINEVIAEEVVKSVQSQFK